MVKSIKSAMGVLTLLGVSSVACLFADEKSGEQAKSPEKSEMRVTEKDRQFWSFQPLMRAPLPAVQQAEWCRTPIDRFILAKQEELGLVATAPVLREKLLRRLSFDLVGLPPSPEELEQFLADSPPDAEQQFVEKLLASPHYGLRWGRHWLDVARYADSAGYERDQDRLEAWHYRDFVIDALNEDMPFDEFVRWQIAGDELTTDHPEAIAATAFLALGPEVVTDTKLVDELARYRYADLDDTLSTTASAFLGLAVGCCRCHDHKFDPLPTRDYYRMLSAFTTGRRQVAPEVLAFTEKTSVPEKTFLMERGDPTSPREEVLLGFLSVLSDQPSEQYLEQARRTCPKPKTTLQRAALALWLTDVEHGAGRLLARVIVNRLWAHHFGAGLVATPSDFGQQGARPTHPELLDWLASELICQDWQLKPIQRLIVSSAVYRLSDQALDPAAIKTSDPENRWLWKRRPDRLEAEILRDAMLSTSGRLNDRLTGPSVRVPLPEELVKSAYNLQEPYPTGETNSIVYDRRSVYLFAKRSLRQPLFELFDGADPNVTCARRLPTTVAPQALALLNDPFVRRCARSLAERVLQSGSEQPLSAQIALAYRLTLSRAPRAQELLAGVEFSTKRMAAREGNQRLALADYCQVLFGLNEFLFID